MHRYICWILMSGLEVIRQQMFFTNIMNYVIEQRL
jgi:hypothetical protein